MGVRSTSFCVSGSVLAEIRTLHLTPYVGALHVCIPIYDICACPHGINVWVFLSECVCVSLCVDPCLCLHVWGIWMLTYTYTYYAMVGAGVFLYVWTHVHICVSAGRICV